MTQRRKYKPKEENIRKLFAFVKQIEERQQNKETGLPINKIK